MIRELVGAGPASECLSVIVPRNSTLFVFSFVLAASLLGCADHRAFTKTDVWVRPPDHWSAGRDATSVQWVEVKPAASVEAERRLSSVEAERVSPEEASKYAATPLNLGGDEEPYLVRALYLNRGTGRFKVAFDGRDLYVHHRSLGHHAVPMSRQPLLVALPRPPEHVYVSVSMAE